MQVTDLYFNYNVVYNFEISNNIIVYNKYFNVYCRNKF